jgi:hypothetical protein
MSDEEIRREYRLAKDPKKQLKILADENDCSVSTIRSIVSADQLSGFVPIQELVEKEKEKETEKKMIVIDPAPTTPTAEPEWPPLPSAPPQAAADFDDAAPKQRDEAPQETAEEAVARSIKEASRPLLSAQTHFPREPWPWPSSEDNSECSADWRGLVRNLADEARATCIHSPESGAEPAEAGMTSPPLRGSPPLEGRQEAAGESGPAFRISGKDLSRMWHVLGRLQGVLEASAEAGRPGEVMKDACDELDVILCGIQQDAG